MSFKVLVAGGGGFIGGFLVEELLNAGHSVRSVDVKPISEWYQVHAEAENLIGDLGLLDSCVSAVEGVDRVYNLAADMGGMGFIENNKALCMLSVLINTHLLEACRRKGGVDRYFYASSACVYNASKQHQSDVTALREDDAYPAAPEDGYGWEKLFSERMCRHFFEDFQIPVRVARFHNVYGPNGTWRGGREKAPAAICRKVAESVASGSSEIEIWGDGLQTRSFMYIDDCIEGIERIVKAQSVDPVNLGSSELVSINELVDIVSGIAGVSLTKRHDLTAPQGVRGRNSDNEKLRALVGWEPTTPLKVGLDATYRWITEQMGMPVSS